MEKIISRSNEKIKNAALLLESAGARREAGLFLLEGARLCADAADGGIVIVQAFFTPDAAEKYAGYVVRITKKAQACYEITPEVGARLTDTRSPQGVFCVCKTLDNKPDKYKIDTKGHYIALENIQDPSNLGGVCRTAEALGIDGLIISGGCDIYNPKALRAAMGSSLRLNIVETENLPELLIFASSQGMLTSALTPAGGSTPLSILKSGRGNICVIGNEGAGLAGETLAACAEKIAIPMKGKAESLNAAACAAIIMWELVK